MIPQLFRISGNTPITAGERNFLPTLRYLYGILPASFGLRQTAPAAPLGIVPSLRCLASSLVRIGRTPAPSRISDRKNPETVMSAAFAAFSIAAYSSAPTRACTIRPFRSGSSRTSNFAVPPSIDVKFALNGGKLRAAHTSLDFIATMGNGLRPLPMKR